MQEGLETRFAVQLAGRPEFPDEARQGGHQPKVEPASQFKAVTGHQQAAQRQHLQGQDNHPVGFTEQDRGRFDSDLQIIVAIDHGVVGVIAHRPQQVGDVQQPGDGRQLAAGCGEGHGNAPGVSRPEHHLRVVGVALHEGVAGRQRHRAER
ncbi:hypothetical protein D3C84_568230 [compost metagenome]